MPACDTAPQYYNWKVTSCGSGAQDFDVKVEINSNGAMKIGDVVKLVNNSGSAITNAEGTVWINGSTQCMTITQLIAPELITGTVQRATSALYADCAACATPPAA